MKNLKKITRILVILSLVLQISNVKAAISNNNKSLDLEVLASKIASSKEGKDYLAYSFAYGMLVNFANIKLTKSNSPIKNEKINKFKNVSYSDLNEESKKEFSETFGFKNHKNFDELYSGYIESQIKLKESFPDLKVLNVDEIELVILSANDKVDISKHIETTMMEGFWTCIGKKTVNFASCAGISGGITTTVFKACTLTALAGEIAASEGVGIAFLTALLGADVTVCAQVAAGTGVGTTTICFDAYVNALQGCW